MSESATIGQVVSLDNVTPQERIVGKILMLGLIVWLIWMAARMTRKSK